MHIYIVKRILVFIPTLLFICFIAFTINNLAPGDPVIRLLHGETEKPENKNFYDMRYQQVRHQLGLDLPTFYFSIKTLADPDTLYKISNAQERKALNALVSNFGNWNEISSYYLNLKKAYTNNSNHPQLSSILHSIIQCNNIEQLDFLMEKLKQQTESTVFSESEAKQLLLNTYINWQSLKTNSSKWKCFIPKLRLHGNNQFHRWLFGDGKWMNGENAVFTRGIIRGDFGRSYITGKSVGRQLHEKTKWTIFFSLTSILLAYLISIPIGVKSGSKPGLRFDRWSSGVLALLYSMPAFFVATLLMMLFANQSMLNWFPSSGVAPVEGYAENLPFYAKVITSLPYIVLPMICYTYGSLAFLARAVRSGMMEVMEKEYILTARAKGMTEHTISWKHAFRNALFPLITILAYVFPAMVGGSAILETIFSIPGLGLEIVNSIFNQDYPVITAVFLITGFLTMVGYLFSDILYTWADPRIKLN